MRTALGMQLVREILIHGHMDACSRVLPHCMSHEIGQHEACKRYIEPHELIQPSCSEWLMKLMWNVFCTMIVLQQEKHILKLDIPQAHHLSPLLQLPEMKSARHV